MGGIFHGGVWWVAIFPGGIFLEPFETYQYTHWRYRQYYKMQNFLLVLNKVIVTLQLQKFRYGYSRQVGRVGQVELFKRNAI